MNFREINALSRKYYLLNPYWLNPYPSNYCFILRFPQLFDKVYYFIIFQLLKMKLHFIKVVGQYYSVSFYGKNDTKIENIPMKNFIIIFI